MSAKTIRRLAVTNFTAFAECEMEFCPGVNVLVGPNSTGKTHVLKLLYSTVVAYQEDKLISVKLANVFLPHERRLGRLVRRQRGGAEARVAVGLGSEGPRPPTLRLQFSTRTTESVTVSGANSWRDAVQGLTAVYIPAKEILASAPGLRSLYSARVVSFDETYPDLLDRALRPPLRGKPPGERAAILETLRKGMAGRVEADDEQFFHRSRQGRLEFTLLAEGLRKLGLLYVLVQNGVLGGASILFWDEPESNLNPRMSAVVARILLELQRQGAQVILATHDDVLLAELDLLRKPSDQVRFFSLYREGPDAPVQVSPCDHVADLHPDAIAEVRADILQRAVARTMRGER